MATTGYHNRSNSFPSRAHPLTSKVDEHLSRLASSESASTSSSLNQKLGEYVDELLNGSLGLLDVFTTAKDVVLQVKERTRGATKGFANEVRKYLSSKKAAKRAILKTLKNLKHEESTALNETYATVSILREVQAVTLSMLESLFSFTFCLYKTPSLVSKLLHTKRVNSKGEQHIKEMANAEASLLSLATSKTDLMQIEKVQNELKLS
ncbi:hypothetical protein ES332_D01G214300v1 [Gossypium tomentosum]|uniref:Uncharacterized protein n=1 Tax=Gossypium tomentosum TaxID=34277 RepID=A0A5D2MCM2_GOSTO|nr:hypothetical protein ES332_D01G214300v1 [Gossypium tomentosum]